ncbi:hypothetical protein BDDG_09125 [Blastomyces dermatitidis ATCC 18188]|uniref:Uncharacterized protein n=1 Tax=Ajellomyces dermatitidis (strain ATCC 18188 / CBS 674.68) TaxID=653446 RepID=F2TSG7_AJEDA|nr:hypothetical protein BDDG_09125 [Blastomyces dermatitidis ATCC 18188]
MGHHGRRRWRHNGAHLKVRSALGAGNALVGAAVGHKDGPRGDREATLEPYENIDEITAAVVKVDERGRFLGRSNLNDLRARQAQGGSGNADVVVSTVIHVVLENGSTVGKFTVPTLPATISNSDLGQVTILAETNSPSVVPTAPPNNAPIGPTPSPATSEPNSSVPGNGATPQPTPSDPPVNSPTDPTSSIPDSSTPSSDLPTSTTDMSLSGSTSTFTSSPVADFPAPSPSSVSSTSITENVRRPTFIVLPISTSTTSSVSIPPGAHIGLLPSESSQPLLPSTTSSFSDTFLPILPSSSALLVSTSSTYPSLSITSSTASTSSSSAASSKSALKTTTYAGGFGGGREGGGGGGGGDPTATTSPGGMPTFAGGSPADASSSSNVPTSKVVGGVVGGVAGIVLLIAVALLLLRNWKRKTDPSGGLTAEDQGTAAILHTGVEGLMSERSVSGGSTLGAAALFSKWRNSHQSTRSFEPPPSSERGFQKVSGRKITSVLESGGDGYDDPFGVNGEKLYYETTSAAGAVAKETGSRTTSSHFIPPSSSSFQPRPTLSRIRISRSASPIAQALHTPPLGRPPSQESDSSAHVVFRPSPARTPLTSSADVTTTTTLSAPGSIALHPPPHQSLPRLPVHRRVSVQDAIGRSIASSDGSRTSRFTEAI